MSVTRRVGVHLVSLALGLTVTVLSTVAQSPHVLVPADKVQWGPAPPSLPAGAQISVLEGNPSEKGAVTLRLRFPARYTIPPHRHSMTERVTVLSGALHVGMGDKVDRQASQTLEPGGFVSLPADMPHFAWTAAPTVIQISLEGPFDIVYVNPADDPEQATDEAVAAAVGPPVGRPVRAEEMRMTKSGTVRANGQELYYEIHGEGEPLVLVMGIGYDSTLWTLAQVPALSQTFQVVIFDNRDAGRSSQATSAYTIADMADDMAGLMGALDIKKAHVCGLSMGGMIATEFALRHPGRLDRMILTGTPAAPARAAFHPITTWNWIKANDKTGEIFAGQQFTWLFSSAFLRNREAVQRTVAMLSSNPNPVGPQAYDRQAQAFLRFDVMERLAGVKAPTLCIVGEQDLLTPVSECREVADRIPGARFEVITGDGSSHVVPIERADDFNRLVTTFLSERQTVSAANAFTNGLGTLAVIDCPAQEGAYEHQA